MQPPAAGDNPDVITLRPHPRVIARTEGDTANVTILLPRNPLRLAGVATMILGPAAIVAANVMALIVFGRNPAMFQIVLAVWACALAWLIVELPTLLRGLHTRAKLTITPDEVRAVIRHLWFTKTETFRRDRVIGARMATTASNQSALHLRLSDSEPLELMVGYPQDQIAVAIVVLKHALSEIAPAGPVLRADDVATLPYAGAGRSYEVEIRRLADGSVSVVVPPPLRNATRTLGGAVFALMWLALFVIMMRTSWRRMWWCPIVPMFLIGGTYALAAAVRDYLRRGEPLVIVRTRDELVIENGPRFRRSIRIPRASIEKIERTGSGRERRMVLAVKAKGKRAIELMATREPDEIKRVVDALNDAT